MLRMSRALVGALCGLLLACGGSNNPTSPSGAAPPTTTPPAGPVTLAGTVTAAAGAGGRVSGATVTVLDGANAGRSTATNTSGEFTFTNLTRANANVSASASGFLQTTLGVFVDGAAQLAFVLQPVIFTRSGTGANVFDMPTYVRRIRIQGFYGGRCENFIIRIAGRTVVNEILGNCSVATGRDYDGTFVTSGGVTEILFSNGISWTFTEVR